MALPGFKLPGAAGGASGAEMMLRSMGLGEMVDMAKSFAESGVLDKIVQFSEGLDELNSRLANIERDVAWLREHGVRPDAGGQSLFSGAGVSGYVFPAGGDERIRWAGAEPGSGSAGGGLAELPDVGLPDGSAAGGSSGPGDARSPNGSGRSRRSRAAATPGGSE